MLFCSAALLLYTAVVVPVQICLWTYEDPCTSFPTLYFDVMVDAFFMVCLCGTARVFRIMHRVLRLYIATVEAPQQRLCEAVLLNYLVPE